MTQDLIKRLELLKDYTGPFGIEMPSQAIDECISTIRQWAHEPKTVEAIARAIYTRRNGKLDYNAWRSDVRIGEAYREDAKAALALVGGERRAASVRSEVVKQAVE